MWINCKIIYIYVDISINVECSMNKKTYNKVIHNVCKITDNRSLLESLAKVILNSHLDRIEQRDMEGLIIILLKLIKNMRKQTENLNILLKI